VTSPLAIEEELIRMKRDDRTADASEKGDRTEDTQVGSSLPRLLGPDSSSAGIEPPLSPEYRRFLTCVEKKEDTGCWVWRGYTYVSGYGGYFDGEKRRRAHRASWELANGPIPDGMLVLHRCDNRPCVNPDHLFLGTDSDNRRDCVAKNRTNQKRGSDGRFVGSTSRAGETVSRRAHNPETPGSTPGRATSGAAGLLSRDHGGRATQGGAAPDSLSSPAAATVGGALGTDSSATSGQGSGAGLSGEGRPLSPSRRALGQALLEWGRKL
jgi:hypothetical protein